LYRIFTKLGASVTKLGFSDRFMPVDTEAIRAEDVELAANWAKEYDFDTIISTDGDSDRPLISDEAGKWLRGDVAGILGGIFYGADIVVTPVSCNTAVEKCGSFKAVYRTRIGSPYVIADMMKAVDDGGKCVVGYEANGGFLTLSTIKTATGKLDPLPTRDPVIVQLGILGLSVTRGVPISRLLIDLPARITFSDRLKEFPSDISKANIDRLSKGSPDSITHLFPGFGKVKETDTTDGLRITFKNEEVVHLRPSGNAPELRCYTEAQTEERAKHMNQAVLEIISTWRP
jgi:phosphomannomutase